MSWFFAYIIVLLSLFSAEGIEADALANADYLGDWQLVSFDEVDAWAKILRIEKTQFLMCESAQCVDPVVGNKIRFLEDVIFLVSKSENEKVLQLVLGGYMSRTKSVLFGTRFHYRDGVIISGIPIIYKKKASPFLTQNRSSTAENDIGIK